MNNHLFFFILTCSFLVLTLISICHAPLINGIEGLDWTENNCQRLDDEYEHNKKIAYSNNPTTALKVQEKIEKRKIQECKNHKAMRGLEFSAFIIDIVLGFICALLSLIHFLEHGKPFEKISGIIGLATGAITAIITIIYVAFSALIFNNEANREINILYKNKASLHWNGVKYIHDYDETKATEEDSDLIFIKYKDMGKIQYNYDSDFYQMMIKSEEYQGCLISGGTTPSTQQTYSSNNLPCNYLWSNDLSAGSVKNKYLYDRWLTTIILGVFDAVCGIGLAIFGVLLFLNGGSSSGHTPV